MRQPINHCSPETSFAVADLILIRDWAAFHGLRFCVELDNVWEGEALEEVVALYPPASGYRRWTLWRCDGTVTAQSSFGAIGHFRSAADALNALIVPASDPPPEDINPVVVPGFPFLAMPGGRGSRLPLAGPLRAGGRRKAAPYGPQRQR